jgi:hypothetical protein
LGLIAPSLSRDTSWKILPLVADAKKPVPVVLDVDVPNDNLVCEWMYVIDLNV